MVYVNTLLPFAAAVAGRLRSARVVYHLHEVAVRPAILHGFLLGIASRFATQGVYVSAYLQKTVPLPGVPSRVVHNAVDPAFTSDRPADARRRDFTALMLCSLRADKGIYEFYRLARRVPEVRFRLVVPEEPSTISEFFGDREWPANLEIVTGTGDIRRHYAESHLLLSLSRPAEWVESFGMTILEAMHFGLPSIVPPVGGPLELVREGHNGYLIDPHDVGALAAAVRRIAEDRDLYDRLARNAGAEASRFHYERFLDRVSEVVVGREEERTPVVLRRAS